MGSSTPSGCYSLRYNTSVATFVCTIPFAMKICELERNVHLAFSLWLKLQMLARVVCRDWQQSKIVHEADANFGCMRSNPVLQAAAALCLGEAMLASNQAALCLALGVYICLLLCSLSSSCKTYGQSPLAKRAAILSSHNHIFKLASGILTA